MIVLYALVAIVLALALAASALALFRAPRGIEQLLNGIGVPSSTFAALGGITLAGAAGLVIGIWVPVVGVLAALGVMLYFAGAITLHVRARDPNIAPPILFGMFGLLALLFRLSA